MAGARKERGKTNFVSTLKRSFSRRQIDIPNEVDIPVTAKRGYLRRLSGKKILSKSDWKRKFFLLFDDKLYYYNSEGGCGGEAGSGVVDLRYFIDCVEAPVTDHKKATNVFILLAKERGFFDQGRYYLSADTLSDMKDWIIKIKAFLCKKILTRPTHSERNPSMRRDTAVTENLYASIKEASIHRSNSMSTIPSQHNDCQGTAYDWHNRSMDLGPVCLAGGEEHNLTYSYSSSEESLNESITVSFPQKSSRSAESSLKRKDLRMSTNSKIVQKPNLKNEGLVVSPHVQKTYATVSLSDKRLESSSTIPRKIFINSRETTLSRSTSSTASNSSARSSQSQVPIQTLNKMELILKKATKQSEDLSIMFKNFEAESYPVQKKNDPFVNSDKGMESTLSNLGKTITSFQSFMGSIEREAGKLNKDIEFTRGQVVQALAEAEQEKFEFEKMRDEVEHVLLQLQGRGVPQDMQVVKKSSNQAPVYSFPNSEFTEPYECHTLPKYRVHKVERNTIAMSGLVSELEDEDEFRSGSSMLPVYAQVRKPLRPQEGKKVVRDVDMQY